MNTVSIKKREYKGWKNCIQVSNRIVDLIATTDVGPRIIYFGFTGKRNELCEVEEHIGTTGGNEWKIYGGHRLWHSPEDRIRTYEPDNSKIEWEEKRDGIILRQPIEPKTLIKKEIEITLSPESANATILHRLINKGLWNIELSAWAITVMAPGGKEIIPHTLRDTGLLPNRMLSLWPYTRMNDPRVTWGEKYIMLQQDKNVKQPFKIGLSNENGWAAYINNSHMFLKQFQHVDDVVYPDYSASSYETYTCDFMLEMESLSPLAMLEPGDFVEHTEVWHLYDNIKTPESEEEIENTILPLVR